MAAFIVESVGPGGQRGWIYVDAADSQDARTKASRLIEQGWIPGISVAAGSTGIQTMRRDSPGFSDRYPADRFISVQSIVNDLQRTTTGQDIGRYDPDALDPVVQVAEPRGRSVIGGPGDPISPEEGIYGSGVAFRRALESDPLGRGAFGGFVRGLQNPLSNILGIGVPAGSQRGPFAGYWGGDEATAQQGFFERALNQLRGGQETIGGLARSVFDAPATFESQKYLTPDFSEYEGVGNAQQFAQLARLAARQQFGAAMANRLTSAEDLVEEFRAQPKGMAGTTPDFRTFLSARLQRGAR